ncbi:MAG: hypothetical protein LUH16_03980 [Clostridiales bacterium]|nr:hypothetical protein [Clostridiales bacterium]
MDKQRAKEILATLADGVNPVTGEVLPAGDSCNQVEVVRALYAAVDALTQPASRPKPTPANAGKPWTQEELDQLADEFETGMKISEMSQIHGRTQGGIEAKLVQIGKLNLRSGWRS